MTCSGYIFKWQPDSHGLYFTHILLSLSSNTPLTISLLVMPVQSHCMSFCILRILHPNKDSTMDPPKVVNHEDIRGNHGFLLISAFKGPVCSVWHQRDIWSTLGHYIFSWRASFFFVSYSQYAKGTSWYQLATPGPTESVKASYRW